MLLAFCEPRGECGEEKMDLGKKIANVSDKNKQTNTEANSGDFS